MLLVSVLAGIYVHGAVGVTASLAHASQAAFAVPESLTATVHAVDRKAQRLALLTGVGHAVRVIEVDVDPRSQIKVRGFSASLVDLTPGQMIRVRYRQITGRKVAEMIETLDAEGRSER
jgi:hypothetical protein